VPPAPRAARGGRRASYRIARMRPGRNTLVQAVGRQRADARSPRRPAPLGSASRAVYIWAASVERGLDGGASHAVPGERIVVTKERFAQGMTPRQYLDQMTMNRDRFLAAMASTTIRPEESSLPERLGGARNVLILTEDWCGTSIASVPFVFKLGEQLPELDIRVFLRDENPDVMDQFLKNGVYRSIPVIVFFDDRMRELARFIERRPA
jgi:hypothetical protein